MKTCYVSMPFGIKTDPATGMAVDFDTIYNNLIKPAIEGTQYSFFRLDDLVTPGDLLRSVVSSVISSDIMIADLTMQNPNVMYELGMRHMAQRGLTIMICATGTRLPSNISGFRVISYQLNNDGSVSENSKSSFHQLLRYSIESNLDQTVTDSPVYQMFPDVHITLPEELISPETVRKKFRKPTKRKPVSPLISSSANQSIEALKEIQSDVLSDPESVDPIEYIRLLKNYRDISAWGDLVELAETVPDNIKRTPEVQQLYALALNRLGKRDQAIAVMESLVAQTGGDAESYGILGRIYKDMYIAMRDAKDEAKSAEYLDKAIYYYRTGFEKQPTDYYTGVNVVNLLMVRKDSASKDELGKILPRVREAIKNKMSDGVPDYWAIATAMELSTIAGDWGSAEDEAKKAIELAPENWMLQTTLQNLELIKQVQDDKGRYFIDNIISILKERTRPAEGQRYA